MSKDDGYSLYTCDRTPKHSEYAKPGTAAANSWHEVKRRSKDGVDQTWLYCKDCYAGYMAQAGKSDDDFQAWMNGGAANG